MLDERFKMYQEDPENILDWDEIKDKW